MKRYLFPERFTPVFSSVHLPVSAGTAPGSVPAFAERILSVPADILPIGMMDRRISRESHTGRFPSHRCCHSGRGHTRPLLPLPDRPIPPGDILHLPRVQPLLHIIRVDVRIGIQNHLRMDDQERVHQLDDAHRPVILEGVKMTAERIFIPIFFDDLLQGHVGMLLHRSVEERGLDGNVHLPEGVFRVAAALVVRPALQLLV